MELCTFEPLHTKTNIVETQVQDLCYGTVSNFSCLMIVASLPKHTLPLNLFIQQIKCKEKNNILHLKR